MITFVRTAAIASGKTEEAIAFARRIANFVTDKSGAKVSVNMPIGGNPWRISWVSTAESLADAESRWAKLLADSEYRKMVEASQTCFLPGMARDEYWTSI